MKPRLTPWLETAPGGGRACKTAPVRGHAGPTQNLVKRGYCPTVRRGGATTESEWQCKEEEDEEEQESSKQARSTDADTDTVVPEKGRLEEDKREGNSREKRTEEETIVGGEDGGPTKNEARGSKRVSTSTVTPNTKKRNHQDGSDDDSTENSKEKNKWLKSDGDIGFGF